MKTDLNLFKLNYFENLAQSRHSTRKRLLDNYLLFKMLHNFTASSGVLLCLMMKVIQTKSYGV